MAEMLEYTRAILLYLRIPGRVLDIVVATKGYAF